MAVTDMTQQRLIVGRVGRVPWLDEPEAVVSMDLVKVDPTAGVDREFIYCWLRFSDFGPTAAQHANGANVLHLSPKAVADLPICLPDMATQRAFGEQVRPMFSLVETLAVAERHLVASRDLLLPRLIFGQLSVEAAERELENAA
jgi:type I restriction enzyme S subunit